MLFIFLSLLLKCCSHPAWKASSAVAPEDTVVFDTHSILETEQHHLQLADGGAVKVQLQLQLRQRAGNDLPVGHAHELGQAHHQGGDVLRLQPGFLWALQARGAERLVGSPPWISLATQGLAPSIDTWHTSTGVGVPTWNSTAPTCASASIRLATTLPPSSVRMWCSVALRSLSFRSMKKPESFSSGDGGALWSSKFSTGMLRVNGEETHWRGASQWHRRVAPDTEENVVLYFHQAVVFAPGNGRLSQAKAQRLLLVNSIQQLCSRQVPLPYFSAKVGVHNQC